MSKNVGSQRGHKWRKSMAHTHCTLDKQDYTHAHAHSHDPEHPHTRPQAHTHTQKHIILTAFPRQLFLNAPQYCVIRTFPVLSILTLFYLTTICAQFYMRHFRSQRTQSSAQRDLSPSSARHSKSARTQNNSMNCLQSAFSDSTRSREFWPRSSPDLNPCNVHWWSIIKNEVHSHSSRAEENLQDTATTQWLHFHQHKFDAQ